MTNLETNEKKLVKSEEIQSYILKGFILGYKGMKPTTCNTTGFKWMYHPQTGKQKLVRKEEIEMFLNRGFLFGNIKKKRHK